MLCYYVLLLNFFFKDTATTEIYTDRHTLSLHDALPIVPDQGLLRPRHPRIHLLRVRAAEVRRSGVHAARPEFRSAPEGEAAPHRVRDGRRDRREVHRSEEHTSELQSLMRISYAVFCLKKKKNKKSIRLKTTATST